MKRNRFSSRKRISADATEVGRLAIGLAESGSIRRVIMGEPVGTTVGA